MQLPDKSEKMNEIVYEMKPGRRPLCAGGAGAAIAELAMIVSVKTDVMHAVTHACIRILNHM